MFPRRSRYEHETFWREKVSTLRQRYEEATAKADAILRQQRDFPLSLPDVSISVRQALHEQNAARSEFMECLEILNDIVSHSKKPEDR
jgi:hypothetical protein